MGQQPLCAGRLDHEIREGHGRADFHQSVAAALLRCLDDGPLQPRVRLSAGDGDAALRLQRHELGDAQFDEFLGEPFLTVAARQRDRHPQCPGQFTVDCLAILHGQLHFVARRRPALRKGIPSPSRRTRRPDPPGGPASRAQMVSFRAAECHLTVSHRLVTEITPAHQHVSSRRQLDSTANGR